MSERIIVENRSEFPMEHVLILVARVIKEGRISGGGEEYCYYTQFANGVGIETYKNKKSDRFVALMQVRK